MEATGNPHTKMEAKLAAITASLNEAHVLLASCAWQFGVKEQEGKEASKGLVAIMTGSLFAPDLALEQTNTKPSSPSFIPTHRVMAAGVPHTDAISASAMPTRCLTSCLDVNDVCNHSAVMVSSLGSTEAAVLRPPELSLDKTMKSCIDIKFNPALGCRQTIGGIDHAAMALSTGLISVDVIDPSETLPICQLQPFAVLDPEKPTLTMCSTNCMDDDASRAISMVSRGVSQTTNMLCVFTHSSPPMLSVAVQVCDNTKDVAVDMWFKEVLQRDNVEWKPWPLDMHVWVSHKKPICRPRPWPSFASNQLKGMQMTLDRPPWQRTYLLLPTKTLAMLKCLSTEGTHLFDIWWSPARHLEHWYIHDIVLGIVTVSVLGHSIKQMMAGVSRRQSLIQFTLKPSTLLVITLPAISLFHVEHLLAMRLSCDLDPRGSRYACWVLNSKNYARIIMISFMNLLLYLNVWERSKSRILAGQLSIQWEPGIMLNVLRM